MYLATSIAQWTIRLTGVTQVVLGLLFWSGRAYTLLPLHMAVGMTFVIALWVLTALAARAGLPMRWALAWVGLGIVIPLFGTIHPRILPGPNHWIIRVIHLLIGLVAMIIAARLASYIRSRPRGRRAAPPHSDVLNAA